MSGIRTEYEFVLPRGYLDETGALHRRGVMRMATARDELEPLRDPTILGPDDPRITILVLARVVRTLGTHELVTPHEIEGLFAADLAYLQDFYGVINFGSDADIASLLEAQRALDAPPAGKVTPVAPITDTPATGGPGGGSQGEPTVVDVDDTDAGGHSGRRWSGIEEVRATGR
jgi:hypothetical protein